MNIMHEKYDEDDCDNIMKGGCDEYDNGKDENPLYRGCYLNDIFNFRS